MPEGFKITSAANCHLLESALLHWLNDVPPSKRCKLIFQHDNAPCYSAKATQLFLSSFGSEGDRLMEWPACSPDLNPIENFWGILKQAIYHDGKQYNSKEGLWNATKAAADNVRPSEIKKSWLNLLTRELEWLCRNKDRHKPLIMSFIVLECSVKLFVKKNIVE